MLQDVGLLFEILTAEAAAEQPGVRVHGPVMTQRERGVETHLALVAEVRLDALVTTDVRLQAAAAAQPLRTDVAREPRTFVVRPEQMRLELEVPPEAVGAVSAHVRLGVGVNADVAAKVAADLEALPAVRAVVGFPVAVGVVPVPLQVAGITIGFVALRTLVAFVSGVDAGVGVEIAPLAEGLAALVALERFLPGVSSPVIGEVLGQDEALAADGASERSVAGMGLPVQRQLATAPATVSALGARVFPSVNVHVPVQRIPSRETLLALGARVQLSCSGVRLFVIVQTFAPCESFVAHRTHMRPRLAITRLLITIGFRLHLERTFTCTTCAHNTKSEICTVTTQEYNVTVPITSCL